MPSSALLNNCTLCILKPHLIRNGELGQAIDSIHSNGFEISAAHLFNLSRPQIEEFYDVYKGVLPEYIPLIEHMSNGPTLILEVRTSGDAVSSFRDFVGPYDPEVAIHLKPNTFRAKFG
jgi:nucleoside-diphosphate kinase